MRQGGPRVTNPNPQNVTGVQPSAFGGFGTLQRARQFSQLFLGCIFKEMPALEGTPCASAQAVDLIFCTPHGYAQARAKAM